MADDFQYHGSYRTSGKNPWYNEPINDAGTLSKIYLGIVKGTQDPYNMGRLLVHIPEISGDLNKMENWVICTYCSPFAGASFFDIGIHIDQGLNTQVKDQKERAKDRTPEFKPDPFYSGRQSYGMWFVPPDVGNEVLIIFLNGDPTRAVWIGCLFAQDMNYMVPGIAADTLFSGGDNISDNEQGPVIEQDSRYGDTGLRKMYQPLRDGLKLQQGLDKDAERGQSTSSAQRESPSKVFGILTPDGNSFVMDDKEDEEFIRLRTKSGVQILFHQTKGFIYMITKDGKTWIELSNEGNVDIYSERSVSVHALTQDINLKAGRDINIHAGNDINIRADRNMNLAAGKDCDINILESMTTTVNKSYNLKVIDKIVNEVISGPIHIKASTNIAINADTEIGLTAIGNIREQGANVFMNSGPGPQANTAIDATFPRSYNEPGPASQETATSSWEPGEPYEDNTNIVPRVPQHEPWQIHEIQTLGTSRNIPEGPPADVRPGSTSKDATAPNSVNLPNATRQSDGFFNAAGLPEFPTVEDFDPACTIPPVQRQISEKGINLIKKFEGDELSVYKDVAGLDTIGAGHLITDEDRASGIFDSGKITQEQSDALLLQDLDNIQRQVRGCLTQNVTQEQYDALVSMAFNIGGGAFCKSTLVKKLNNANYVEAPNEMMRWTKATVNGNLTLIQGLVNRRIAEATLFAEAPANQC